MLVRSDQAEQLQTHIGRGHLVLCLQLGTPEDFSVVCGRLVQASPHGRLCNIKFGSAAERWETVNANRACAAIAFGTWSLLALAGSSLAQSARGPQRGYELATRLCINCHVVDRQASGPMRADVPTFAAIANRPGKQPPNTSPGGSSFLIRNARCSPDGREIRDIVTYIISLKRNP